MMKETTLQRLFMGRKSRLKKERRKWREFDERLEYLESQEHLKASGHFNQEQTLFTPDHLQIDFETPQQMFNFWDKFNKEMEEWDKRSAYLEEDNY
jgi:hypothetical protein